MSKLTLDQYLEGFRSLRGKSNRNAERFTRCKQLRQKFDRVDLEIADELKWMFVKVSEEQEDPWPTLQAMYWSCRSLDRVFRKVFKELFGQEFNSQPMPFDVMCPGCEKTVSELCISWTAYTRKKMCQPCRQAEYHRKQAEAHRQWEAECRETAQERRERERAEQRRAEELIRLKTMPYKEYLQTEHWQRLRQQTLRRQHFMCQLCNSRKKLHVHHRTYKNRGEEQPWDLIVLCESCHRKFHEIPDPAPTDH